MYDVIVNGKQTCELQVTDVVSAMQFCRITSNCNFQITYNR